jgi:hypothetical protein
MASVPQKLQDESVNHLFTHHDNNQSGQVKNLNQKRMQEHTKKPALSHNKAGNYTALFSSCAESEGSIANKMHNILFLNKVNATGFEAWKEG